MMKVAPSLQLLVMIQDLSVSTPPLMGKLEPIWLSKPLFTVILIDAFSETYGLLFYHSIWLFFCGAFSRFWLHIVDLDPSSVTTGGWLEDTSLVEKYNISEEDYAKRTGKFSTA